MLGYNSNEFPPTNQKSRRSNEIKNENSKVFEQKGDLLNFKANIDSMLCWAKSSQAELSQAEPSWAKLSQAKNF